MSEALKFSIDDVVRYKDDEDLEFAVMKIKFLSDGYNTHGLKISNDVLRSCADTIKGKFVVAKYDERIKDARGHNRDEHIVGIIPKDAVITFEESDNKVFACVDAIISKLYAVEIIEMFKGYNHRAVSVEMMCNLSEDDIVESFNITGVTILGVDVAESCKGASCEVIKFSEEKAEKCYSLWEDNKLGEEKVKEESMANIEELQDTVVTLEEAPVAEPEALAEEEAKEEKPEEMACGEPEKEEAEKCADEEEQPAEEEKPEEMACGDEPEAMECEQCADEEKPEEMGCGCEEAEEEKEDEEFDKKCAEFAEKEQAYLAELSELREFKTKVLEERRDAIVIETLSKAKSRISEEAYAKFEESGKACEYDNINGWRNEVLASLADNLIAMSAKQEEEHLRMELPLETHKPNSLWS